MTTFSAPIYQNRYGGFSACCGACLTAKDFVEDYIIVPKISYNRGCIFTFNQDIHEVKGYKNVKVETPEGDITYQILIDPEVINRLQTENVVEYEDYSYLKPIPDNPRINHAVMHTGAYFVLPKGLNFFIHADHEDYYTKYGKEIGNESYWATRIQLNKQLQRDFLAAREKDIIHTSEPFLNIGYNRTKPYLTLYICHQK